MDGWVSDSKSMDKQIRVRVSDSKSVDKQIKQPKYCQPLFQMVKNLYYHSPHFDLKFWTIDNNEPKMQVMA